MAGTEAGTKVEKISEPIIPLDSRDFENVYEPAEDTFLFMDALEKDLPFLRKLSPSIVLELGSVSIGKEHFQNITYLAFLQLRLRLHHSLPCTRTKIMRLLRR